MEGLTKDNSFKRPRLTNHPYPTGPLLPPYWRPEWGPIPFPPPPPPAYTTGPWGQAGQGYCYPPPPLPQPHHVFMINQHWEQWGPSPQPPNLPYYPPSQSPNDMHQGQRQRRPHPQNFAEDDDLNQKECPTTPQPLNTPQNEAYSSFCGEMALCEPSKYPLSDKVVDEVGLKALEIISRYKDKVTMFEFLNTLLRRHLLAVNKVTKVTVLRVFVHVIGRLNFGEEPPEEVKKMSNSFAEMFDKTLKEVLTYSYMATVEHLKILHSLKSECIRIGFLSKQSDCMDLVQLLDQVDKAVKGLEIGGNEKGNLLEATTLSSQCDVVSSSFSAPVMDIEAQCPVRALEVQLEDANIPTIYKVAVQKTISASLPKKSAASTSTTTNSNSKVVTEEKYFKLNFELQLKNVRSQLMLHVGDCALEDVKLLNLVDGLIKIFVNSRRSGPLHDDKTYLHRVLKASKGLNNDGRKIMLWILVGIVENLASPGSFSQVEADKLGQLFEDMDIEQCHKEWDTIELLALKRRLLEHIDVQHLIPIDHIVVRLTVEKYRVDTHYQVNLNLSDFYPRNLSALKEVAKQVLLKISPVEGIVSSCKNLQSSIRKNTKREPSPDVVCLGTPIRPPPEVVTLSDDD